ncbi:hypothetical protein GCM10010330_16860 [Streptomyces tendae]|nr:hypothetical protein GCM10010330_16860 [Streptomyces tendae]
MSLVLDYLASRFGVHVHYEVSNFMGNIETLAVVILLGRVEYHRGPIAIVKGVGVHGSGLCRAENHHYPMVFRQTHQVTNWPRADVPVLPEEAGRLLRKGAGLIFHIDAQARQIRFWKLDVPFEGCAYVSRNHPVSEGLVTRQLCR